MKRLLIAVAALTAGLTIAPAALAYTLGGGAQAEPGQVRLVSDFSNTSTLDDSSWISLDVPSGLTFAGITSLAAQFNVTDDDCGAGSPRFQITVGGKNVFVYLGPSPTFTGCTQNTWVSTGNLVGTSDACRVDTSQHAPGTQCSTWAAAVALLGSQPVTAITLVVDSGWWFVAPRTQTDQEQTVLVRGVTLNGQTVITPEQPSGKQNPAKLCKAQRVSMGTAAFNETWGTNANDRNAYGKCVSAMAKPNSGSVHSAILNATKACKAKGMKGAQLGACVSARDGVAATKADKADQAGKGKGKKRR
jgi:hypothetical protein